MGIVNIVPIMKCGKLIMSLARKIYIEMYVAFNLAKVSWIFNDETVLEDLVDNIDETQFIVNYDNGKTLGFDGTEKMNYADVVSGGLFMTFLVRFSGGINACIQTVFTIFKILNRKDPIKIVPDNVPGVPYRTKPKGWMEKQVFMNGSVRKV